jgi:rubredoxin
MTIYRCPECGYRYDEAVGDRHEGLKPNTAWRDVPESFYCPRCNVRDKQDFEIETKPDSGNPS